jgi:hypothetical protein
MVGPSKASKGKPPVSVLFGVKARKGLRALELAVEEAETVRSALCAASNSLTEELPRPSG